MKVLTCENGHYFDTDKYPQCPHCGAAVGSGTKPKSMTMNYAGSNSDNSEKPKKEKMKLFGKKKSESVSKSYESVSQTSHYTESDTSIDLERNVSQSVSSLQSNPGESRTVLLEPVVPQESVMQRPNASATVVGNNSTQESFTISIMENANEQNIVGESQFNDNEPISRRIETPIINQQISQPVVQKMNQPTGQAINQIHRPGDDVRTVAFFDGDVEPVTGWLVCVEGESYGESFNIKSGRNLIGRGSNMDIALVGEISVSREKQAILIFEPMKQQFIIQPGEGSSLTYVNDELLLSHVQLKPYDKIRMGNALFVFVPFCGDSFNWNDYPDK